MIQPDTSKMNRAQRRALGKVMERQATREVMISAREDRLRRSLAHEKRIAVAKQLREKKKEEATKAKRMGLVYG